MIDIRELNKRADEMRLNIAARGVVADEEEVIAEFLKAEFYQPEFDAYRETFSTLVYRPDLSNQRDNAVRRGLLFRRRGRRQDRHWCRAGSG